MMEPGETFYSALELHDGVRTGLRDRGLDPGLAEDLQRLRIEVGGEIGGVRRGLREQRVVDADFRSYRLRRR